MTEKKTGFLFPETKKEEKQPKTKTPRKKITMEDTLKKIQETKDRKARLKLIEGIAKSHEAWVCEALISLLENPCEDIREFLIEELSRREDLDLNLIYKRLQRPPWYVKTGCLQILGSKKNAASVKYIETLVNDPNIEVRRTLALVLGEIGGKKALILLTQLSEDKSSFVRSPALQALRDISQVKFS